MPRDWSLDVPQAPGLHLSKTDHFPSQAAPVATFLMTPGMDRIMAPPKDVHILNHRTECGKRDFADVI